MKKITSILLWILILSIRSNAALSGAIYNPARSTGSIQAFMLVDSETDQDMRILKANDSVPVSEPLNIRVITEGNVQSVLFRLTDSTGNTRYRFDNSAPFTAGRSSNSNFSALELEAGTYILTAIPFKYNLPLGRRGQSLSVKLTVLPADTGSYLRFILVNASSNQDILEITDGAVINLDSLASKQLNIKADVGWQATESVRFGLNENLNFRIENEQPYALFGDSAGHYHSWTPAPGQYKVTATAFAADSAGGAQGPSGAITFSVEQAPQQPSYTSYVELNNLVVVYKNTNGGTIPDYYPDSLAAALAETSRFYWRQSHMSLNIKWTVHVIEEQLERVHEFAYVYPWEVDQDLRERGLPVDTFDAVGAVVAGGGAYAWGTNNILGRGSYFQVPWWEEHYLFSWFFVHEFHHILDAMFSSSAHNDYPHNHPGAARLSGEYVPHSGTNWDLNREILRFWPRPAWFDLTTSGNWGKIKSALDMDSDTIPDMAPDLPFDEARYGSSPTLTDTDGDGLTDLQEAMAGIFTPANPLSPDSDNDSIPDLTDSEPIYPIDTTVQYSTGITLEQDVRQWPLNGRYFFNRSPNDSASFHLAYSDSNLYIGARVPRGFGEIQIYLDANNDGLFYGNDNVWIILAGNSTPSVRLLDAASVPPDDQNDHIVSYLPTGGFEHTIRSEAGWSSFQLKIPKLTQYGLDLAEGEQVGIYVLVNGYSTVLEHDDLLSVTLGDTSTDALAEAEASQSIRSITEERLVYPNPAKSEININMEAAELYGDWRIVDSRGVAHLRGKITAEGPATINVASLPTGLYLLYIESAAGRKTYKFIKN